MRGSPFLKIGTILAIFRGSGNVHWEMLRLIILQITFENKSRLATNSFIGTLFISCFVNFKFAMTVEHSSGVQGSKIFREE